MLQSEGIGVIPLEYPPHGQVGREKAKDTADLVSYDFHVEVRSLPARKVQSGAKGRVEAKEMLSSLPPLHLTLTWCLERSSLLAMLLSGFPGDERGLLVQHIHFVVREADINRTLSFGHV